MGRPTPRALVPRLLINRAFALLWCGQVVTDLGNVVFNTAAVLWVAGHVAAGLAPLAALYGVILLAAVCAQFFNPALLALIGDLVPTPDVPRATGLSEATWNLAAVLGPPLAALLLVAASLPWVLALDAVSFTVSFATIAAIQVSVAEQGPPPKVPSRSFRRELAGGLAFVARDRVVRTVAVSLAIAVFGAGALNALNVFFVSANLHAPSAAYGILGGAFGAGSILGALVSGPLASRLGLGRLYCCSLIAVGAIMIAYSRLASIGPAIVVFAILGIPNAAANAAFAALLLRATRRDLVGRASSAVVALYSLAALCSYLLAGILAASLPPRIQITAGPLVFGPLDMLFAAIGVLIMLGGIFAIAGLAHGPRSGL